MMPKLENFEKKLDFGRFSGGRGWDGSSAVGLLQGPPPADAGLSGRASSRAPRRRCRTRMRLGDFPPCGRGAATAEQGLTTNARNTCGNTAR
jgi:hypothetical protein